MRPWEDIGSNPKASRPLINSFKDFITAAENDASEASVFTFLRVNSDGIRRRVLNPNKVMLGVAEKKRKHTPVLNLTSDLLWSLIEDELWLLLTLTHPSERATFDLVHLTCSSVRPDLQ